MRALGVRGALPGLFPRWRWLSPIFWTLYVVVPVSGWGSLSGRPIGPLGTAVLLVVWWGWLFGRRAPMPLIVAGLVVAKLAVGGTLLLEHGFVASYYANDAWQEPHERSTDFPKLAATRIDREIDFDSRPSFPLYFFNDTRFNYYRPTDPIRSQLAFSASWQGWLYASEERDYTVFLSRHPTAGSQSRKQPMYSANAGAEIAINGRPIATLTEGVDHQDATIPLSAGWHLVGIRYRSPYGADPNFSAGIVLRRGEHSSSARVFTTPALPWRVRTDQGARLASWLLDIVLLSGLGAWTIHGLGTSARKILGWARRHADSSFPRQEALAAVALIVIAGLWLRARQLSGVLFLLSGGNDWLTYETFARDIVLNGPLMTLGRPIGQARAFYYQPLYPYFLAVAHWLLGEDFWGVYFCQDLLFAGAVWAIYAVTSSLFGMAAAWLSTAFAVYFRLIMNLNPTPASPTFAFLSESLFIPVLAFWTLVLVRLPSHGPGWWGPAAAGLLGGIAVLTRSTLLLAIPFVLVAIACSCRRHYPQRWAASLVVFMVCLGATVGLATIRNVVVGGQFVVVASSGPVNLLISNQPAPDVELSAAAKRSFYQRIGLAAQTAQVVEYAWQAPKAFIGGLIHKLWYSLGLTSSGREQDFFVLVWVSALIGMVVIMRNGHLRSEPLWFIPAILAGCHLVVVVVVGVFSYGYRLVYPMYLMLIPYSAIALVWVANRAGLSRHDRVNVL